MNNNSLTKITKSKVKSIIKNEGSISVGLLPCKIRLYNPWMGLLWMKINSLEELEKVINSFSYYNCSYETGYYPSYYIEA